MPIARALETVDLRTRRPPSRASRVIAAGQRSVAGPLLAAAGSALVAAAVLATPAAAQDVDTRVPGVRLGMVYEGAYVPELAIRPFSGRFGGEGAASQVESILANDLDFSDRFRILSELPESLGGVRDIDYALWDRLGAVYLLTGTVEGSGNGFVLILRVHDVLYRQVAHEGTFRVPDPNDRGFRMAVHRASDQVVEWVFGEPGMAASRIAFSMQRDDGTKEIYVIDADGANLTRISDHRDLALSPAWSPDGGRIAYTAMTDDGWRIFEHELGSGESSRIEPRVGEYMTPEYLPDGRRLAFTIHEGATSGLYTWDLEDQCCLTNLTGGRFSDTNPSYSPDGRQLVFSSTRLGSAIPQIYTLDAGGGQPELLSPYRYGSQNSFFTAPDWAPFGDNIAFSGRVSRAGFFNILVARMGEGRRLTQLTAEGNNEDPAWAPDGRHIVFFGRRDWGSGLFVVDAASGRTRALLRGFEVGEPDWSPSM